jgi:hypothetical protein
MSNPDRNRLCVSVQSITRTCRWDCVLSEVLVLCEVVGVAGTVY